MIGMMNITVYANCPGLSGDWWWEAGGGGGMVLQKNALQIFYLER